MSAPSLPLDPSNPDRRWILAAALVFSGLSLWGAITSTAFLEADSCTHYMYARASLQDSRYWHYLVNVWGRPVCTGLYAIPALIGGRIAVRITSLLLALVCGWLAYAIAKRQGHSRPALAFIFTIAQPLVYLHSFSELTELPFMTLLTLGFLAYQSRCWWGMALAIGFTPLSRPEGFGFILMAAFALVVHRRFLWLIVLVAPLVAWNHFGWMLYGKQVPWWRWLISEWPYAGTSLYKSGEWYHFLRAMPAVVGPFVFPMVGIGVWQTLTWALRARDMGVSPVLGTSGEQERSDSTNLDTASTGETPVSRLSVSYLFRSHASRIELLIVAIPMMIFVGHSVLYVLGKMASSGELRYMMIVAPFWGILAARGWVWVFDRIDLRRFEMPVAALAAILPFAVNFYYPVLPLGYMPDWHRAERIGKWYMASNLPKDYPRIAASHPGIFYFLDRPIDAPNVVAWLKDDIVKVPRGTLLIWDPVYGIYNADQRRAIPLADLYKAGWEPLTDLPDDVGEFRLFRSKDPAE